MIHIFLGTKAQLIKMAPIMQELERRDIDYNFVFSGQHQATIADINAEFGIKTPDYILYRGRDITGIIQMIKWSLEITYKTLRYRKTVWKNDRHGIVLNHGDTFSTLLGSLLAKLSGLKSAHVESGLRSFNLFHPFPEELTRRLTFLLSNVYFAPGAWALKNLSSYKGVKVDTKLNTLIDSLRASESSIEQADVEIPESSYGIVSIHRFENIFNKNKLKQVINIIENIANRKKLLFILHKPTAEKLNTFGLLAKLEANCNIELRPRYSYFQFIKLVKSAKFVVTDGGSNQEECYYLGKPCLILRKKTERQEGVNKNAMLSEYLPSKVDHFINKMNSYKRQKIKVELSPSSIIVDSLSTYY